MFIGDPDLVMEDVDFSNTHMVLILRESGSLKLGSISLPLPTRKVDIKTCFEIYCA